ncbi:MAG: type II toxin-antitoxin system RelB/DinJ family antitoxin [Bacilli bacterium]|nr:type II toxin-antitoxin system RelB/DinJ family antitoxin [Bacilli bacterium]
MAKTSYVNVRVEEEVKIKAEEILNDLGINTSTAIDMFLKQIILKDGLPFDVRLPKIDYDKAEAELAGAIHYQGELPYPKWFKHIASLYAKEEIDYETALYAAMQWNKRG